MNEYDLTIFVKEEEGLYRKYQELYDRCRQIYEKKYGPLSHSSAGNAEGYPWLDDPWPWELGANKEG